MSVMVHMRMVNPLSLFYRQLHQTLIHKAIRIDVKKEATIEQGISAAHFLLRMYE